MLSTFCSQATWLKHDRVEGHNTAFESLGMIRSAPGNPVLVLLIDGRKCAHNTAFCIVSCMPCKTAKAPNQQPDKQKRRVMRQHEHNCMILWGL